MVPSKSHDRTSWSALLQDGVRTAAEIRRDEDPVRRWFHQPLPALGGMSPAELIEAGRAGEVARHLKARAACATD